jgi:hypothetical protein
VVASQAAAGNDSRLSDARTPTAHAASHASGGTDAVTLTESQVTNLTTDLAAKAPLASPALTGTPTVPTAAQGTNTTQAASTAYVQTEVGLLVPKSVLTTDGDLLTRAAGVPARITRASLAADTAFSSVYAPLASPALTGNPTAPTPTAGDNDTSIATTAFVTTAVAGVSGGGSFDLAQQMAFGG